MMRPADVVVVGAGPAGAASAILLAEHGLSVTVLERGPRPRPKVCGEYLSPEGGRVLDRLGVLKAVDAGGAVALAGMRITAPDGTVLDARYGAVGAFRPYREHAIGVARSTLDGALLDRVRALPIDLRTGVRVTGVVLESGRVAGVIGMDAAGEHMEVRGRVVIAADGRASVIAHRLGCRRPHRLARMALVTYVADVPDCREVGEIFVDPPDYAILNPLAPDRVNLSLVVPLAHAVPWRARLEDFFAARVKQLSHLARRLVGAVRVAPIASLGPLAYRVAPPSEGGVLFVGDAAGFYDPFTGEGIFSALRSAELAAETVVDALRAGDVSAAALSAYDRARRAAFADKARVTRLLQALIARRSVANLAARWFAGRPRVLAALLGVIGDYVPPSALPRLLLS
jgi:menaquinone-9 beta-reductase